MFTFKRKSLVLIFLIISSILFISGCSNDSEPVIISFTDDFSQSNWATKQSEYVSSKYINNEYEIGIFKKVHYYRVVAPDIYLKPEFTIEADMYFLPESNTGNFGLVIYYPNNNDLYMFRIAPSVNIYQVSRNYNNNWSYLTKSLDGESNWLTPETNCINNQSEINHLKITQKDNQIQFYINSHLVFDDTIVNHSEAIRVGLFGSSLFAKEDPDINIDILPTPVIAHYDNFKIYGYSAR